MGKADKHYHNLSRAIIETGYEYKTDNRPQPCIQISSANVEFDLDEFPLLTTKKMFTKGIVEELLWFLRGQDNIRSLVNKGVTIWNKDAYNWYVKQCGVQTPMTFEDFNVCVTDSPGYLESANLLNVGLDNYSVGDVGRNYGVQWRHWQGGGSPMMINLDAIPLDFDSERFKERIKNIGNQFFISIDDTEPTVTYIETDQIVNLLDNLRKPNPINRRHIVTAWNPAEVDMTTLPPCHWAFEVIPRPLTISQKIIHSGGDTIYLNTLWTQGYGTANDEEARNELKEQLTNVPDYGFVLKWHQRSVDTFLRLPFNIASYALLAYIIGSITDMLPLSIIGDLSNVHFYKPHIEIVQEQLRNNPMIYTGPKLEFSQNYFNKLEFYKEDAITFDEFINCLSHEDFIFEDYRSFPALKGEMFKPIS